MKQKNVKKLVSITISWLIFSLILISPWFAIIPALILIFGIIASLLVIVAIKENNIDDKEIEKLKNVEPRPESKEDLYIKMANNIGLMGYSLFLSVPWIGVIILIECFLEEYMKKEIARFFEEVKFSEK